MKFAPNKNHFARYFSRKEKIEVYKLKFNDFDEIIPNLEEAIT